MSVETDRHAHWLSRIQKGILLNDEVFVGQIYYIDVKSGPVRFSWKIKVHDQDGKEHIIDTAYISKVRALNELVTIIEVPKAADSSRHKWSDFTWGHEVWEYKIPLPKALVLRTLNNVCLDSDMQKDRVAV